MELTPGQKDLIVLASNIRGGVKCQLTKERKCGYLIRPELWFVRILEPMERAIEALGLEVKGTYTSSDEIAILLESVKGLEDLSPTPHGLVVVGRTNGRVFQPETHDQVVSVIEHLEELLGVKC